MSLPLPEHYCAALAPATVALTRRRSGWGSVHEPLRIEAACVGDDAEPPWRGAVDVLAGMLAQLPRRRGRLTVVISNHWVRYLIVPWSDGIASPREFALYVAACFERVHGETVADWEMRAATGPAGRARLACAIDRSLLQALTALAADSPLHLASVQPYLMSGLNASRRHLGGGDLLFVLGEAGRACLLARGAGRWCAVRNAAVEDAPALSALVERELGVMGADRQAPPAVFVQAPQVDVSQLAIAGIAPRMLAPWQAAEFAMATP